MTGTEWISGTTVETADGLVWVYAETAGGTVRVTLVSLSIQQAFRYLFTSTLDVVLLPTGTTMSSWTISALDTNFNFVVDKKTVEFIFDESAISVEVAELRMVGMIPETI